MRLLPPLLIVACAGPRGDVCTGAACDGSGGTAGAADPLSDDTALPGDTGVAASVTPGRLRSVALVYRFELAYSGDDPTVCGEVFPGREFECRCGASVRGGGTIVEDDGDQATYAGSFALEETTCTPRQLAELLWLPSPGARVFHTFRWSSFPDRVDAWIAHARRDDTSLANDPRSAEQAGLDGMDAEYDVEALDFRHFEVAVLWDATSPGFALGRSIIAAFATDGAAPPPP